MFAYHQGGPQQVKPVPPSQLLADGRADVMSPVRAMRDDDGGRRGKVATRVQGGLILALQELRKDRIQGTSPDQTGQLSAWVVSPPPKGREVAPAEPLYIRDARREGGPGFRPELYRMEATRALHAAFRPSRMDSGATPAQKARDTSLLGPLLQKQREKKNKQAKVARQNKRRRDEGATGTVVGGPPTEGGTSRGREDLVDQEVREEFVASLRAKRDHYAALSNCLSMKWGIPEEPEEPEQGGSELLERQEEQGGSELLERQEGQGGSELEGEDLIDKWGAVHDEEEDGGKGKETSEELSYSDSGSS